MKHLKLTQGLLCDDSREIAGSCRREALQLHLIEGAGGEVAQYHRARVPALHRRLHVFAGARRQAVVHVVAVDGCLFAAAACVGGRDLELTVI